MLKLPKFRKIGRVVDQPPSGGCVLKLIIKITVHHQSHQPPSGGCVLKHLIAIIIFYYWIQPPSGGCVLKPKHVEGLNTLRHPAAFRRLCVET